MHPILDHRPRLWAYVAVWTVAGILMSALMRSSGEFTSLQSLFYAVPMTLMLGVAGLSAWYLCRVFPLGATHFLRIAFVFGLTATLTTVVWMLAGELWIAALGQLSPALEFAERSVSQWRIWFAIGAILYLLTAAVHYLLAAMETAREREKNEFELKVLAQASELKALRAQINPHFLFNSLNSVSALIGRNPKAARGMVNQLADFFRKSLQYGAEEHITLEQEMELLTHYLEIEHVRFGDRLHVRTEVSDEARLARVPSLLLQPLIENAIKHGVGQRVEGGTVEVTGKPLGPVLELRVRNDRDPVAASGRGTGMGLDNVRRRLNALYGSDANLRVMAEERSFEVVLTLPFRKEIEA